MVWDSTGRLETDSSAGQPIRSAPRGARILIADDQADVLEALRLLLKREGYELEPVHSPAALLSAVKARPFDLLLMDLNYARDTTSGREGLDLLSQIHDLDDTLPIVAMTAWGSVELAVEIMRQGVRDFVLKPWDNARLLGIVRDEIEKGRKVRKAKGEAQAHAKELLREGNDWREAQRTQLGFLPKRFPRMAGCEISGTWLPVHGIGGDYFDAIELDPHRLALFVADVAGKGVAAALVMSNLQATVRSLAAQNLPPAQLASRVNRSMGENIARDRFITFFCGIFDARVRRFSYTNAGHNPPIVVRRDGRVVRLACGGTALGIAAVENYEQDEVTLAEGDRLALFTDGITEATNDRGEEFGEENLVRLLARNRAAGASEIQRNVLAQVANFAGQKFQDDVTLIILALG